MFFFSAHLQSRSLAPQAIGAQIKKMKARFAVGWPCFCFTIICAFHSAEKSQASLAHPSIDDSGINAVKFRCSDGSEVPPLKVWIRQVDISIIPTRSLTNHWIEVSTAEGPDGNWSSWTLCDEGELLNTKLLLPPCRRIYIYISLVGLCRPEHLCLSVSRSQSKAGVS